VYTFATRDRGVRLTGGSGAGDVPALSIACLTSLGSLGSHGGLAGGGFAAAADVPALSTTRAASLGVTGLSGAGFADNDSLAARLTPAIDAHRLTLLCATSCFFAAALIPIVRTSASTASRCSAV